MWSPQELSARYLHQAQDAERYLQEVRGKVRRNPSYERVFDEHLARFYVYNYLHGRTFLETREALLKELESMRHGPLPTAREVFDRERFERYFRTYVDQVIEHLSAKT